MKHTKKSIWRYWRVYEAAGCHRAMFPERREAPRVRPAFSDPLPLKQCEAKRLDKPCRNEGFGGGEASQDSAGGMELWRPELEFRSCQGKGALTNSWTSRWNPKGLLPSRKREPEIHQHSMKGWNPDLLRLNSRPDPGDLTYFNCLSGAKLNPLWKM